MVNFDPASGELVALPSVSCFDRSVPFGPPVQSKQTENSAPNCRACALSCVRKVGNKKPQRLSSQAKFKDQTEIKDALSGIPKR